MDFLEDLFEFGEKKLRKRGGSDWNDDHDHIDDHDHHHPDFHDKHVQAGMETMPIQPGVICSKCSGQSIQGAKFCHNCGAPISRSKNCSACRSKIPVEAPYCPQCGYHNG